MINVMYVGLLLNLIYHSGHNVYTKSVNEASCMVQALTIGCGRLVDAGGHVVLGQHLCTRLYIIKPFELVIS